MLRLRPRLTPTTRHEEKTFPFREQQIHEEAAKEGVETRLWRRGYQAMLTDHFQGLAAKPSRVEGPTVIELCWPRNSASPEHRQQCEAAGLSPRLQWQL